MNELKYLSEEFSGKIRIGKKERCLSLRVHEQL